MLILRNNWTAMLIGVFATCLLGCASDRGSAQVAEDYLRWFPEDTETLVVTQGPFTIPAEELNPPYDLIQAFQYCGPGPIHVVQDGDFRRNLAGSTVLLSVEASRRFRAPSSLGSMT